MIGPSRASQEFEKLVSRVVERLARRDALKELSQEHAHHAPDQILDSAVALAEVAQAVAEQPGLASRAHQFYGDCARRDGVARSLRAHCLARFRQGASDRREVEDLESGLPVEVRSLADAAGK